MQEKKVSVRTIQNIVNLTMFFVGMIGLWQLTHNWIALLWGFIASLNFNLEKHLTEK